jgi:uncharacterized protein (TIGR02246 family)
MSAPSTTSPQATVDALFSALDALDVSALEALFAADPQGVDELSGGWRRGHESVHEYLATIATSGIADVRSTISDAQVVDWGDTALATFVLEQTYTHGGERTEIRAPTTVVLRREDGAWRIALVHSVPLAETT